ncbi:MAG: hypothetical protein ACM3TR_00220 [Caulobacteraceae bacterium]
MPTNNNPQIEAKNLSIVDDQLNHEALAVKKYKQAAQMCTTQELIDICNQGAQRHKKHYDDLLNYLNSHS